MVGLLCSFVKDLLEELFDYFFMQNLNYRFREHIQVYDIRCFAEWWYNEYLDPGLIHILIFEQLHSNN